MRWLLCFVSVGSLALAANGYGQDEKKESAKAEMTTAMYMVAGLH